MGDTGGDAELSGADAIDGIDVETLRESCDRIVRVAVALLDGVGGEVAIRRRGGVWRSSGRSHQGTPIASLVEASAGVLWIEDWTQDPRVDPSRVPDDVKDYPLYVGAPIRLPEGRLLGVLSVLGAAPRPFEEAKAARLMDLAALIADEVERLRAVLAKAAAEAEVAAARATAAAVVECAPLAVSMTDRQMRVLQVSHRWREERGYVGADIIGRSMFDLFPGANWTATYDRVLAGETVRREAQLALPDGRAPWLRYEHTPWLEANGEVGGILSVSIEITELVEALRRAEESETRLKLALEIGELRMWEVDLKRKTVTDAGADTRISAPRQTFEDLTQDVFRGVHPHDRGDVEAAWRRHLTEGVPFRVVCRVVQRNGPHIWIQCASEAIRDEDGEVVRVVNVMRNIDQAKRVELDLQRARDAAEAANRAKNEFLANMSHEIRTPLNGVMGVASALGRTELSQGQREMVALISSSAETLESLLSDVLDLARIESGRLELKPEDFNLEQSLRDVAALFEPSARAKGLDLTIEVAPAAAGLFVGDAPRLRQVMSNLVSNAVKFTAQGIVRIRLHAEPAGEAAAIRVSVADTGIGFDAETAARLFERFEQADGSITRRYGGTGLGLAISRSLVEAMGGRMTALSLPGRGSTFAFEVTLRRSSAAAGEPAPSPLPASQPTALGELRVLLAEDHPTNRRVVQLILCAAGVDLTCVENGAEAVDAWAKGAFDLILMDMQMPVMDGLTAIRAIRERESHEARSRTPIYSLTANAMPEHASASARAGADGHLTKPISAEALLRAVAEAAASPPQGEPRPAETA
jgi:PAS domain S-box-containing protein